MKTLTALFVAVLATVFMTSCASYKNDFMEECKADNNTEEQCKHAYQYAWRTTQFSKENPDHTYTIIYSRLTTTEVREELDDFLRALKTALDYANQDWAQFIDTFGMRKPLEHKYRVLKEMRSGVRTDELYTKYKGLMGELSSSDMEHARGYSSKRIFLPGPASRFTFTSSQIEEAKQRGVLKPIEHIILDLRRELDRKDKDPAHPDDPKEYIWKSKSVNFDLTNYKIMDVAKPDTNLGNYIEGYRVMDGKKESKPALKVFFTQSGMAVVVVDSKREGKDPGFGLPDYVEEMTGVVSVKNVIAGLMNDEPTLSKLFEEKDEETRAKPELKKIFVEIKTVGEPVDPWEKAADANGWLVPFKYWNDRKNNYNIKIKFKTIHDHNPDQQMPDFREIEWIAKEWTDSDRYTPSVGAVVEYFRPKSDFAKKIQAEVLFHEDTKKIRFAFEDGVEKILTITPASNVVIEEKPFAIAYAEGQKRWWLEKDSGSNVFNKRKGISTPKEKTGNYEKNDEETGEMPNMMKRPAEKQKAEAPVIR